MLRGIALLIACIVYSELFLLAAWLLHQSSLLLHATYLSLLINTRKRLHILSAHFMSFKEIVLRAAVHRRFSSGLEVTKRWHWLSMSTFASKWLRHGEWRMTSNCQKVTTIYRHCRRLRWICAKLPQNWNNTTHFQASKLSINSRSCRVGIGTLGFII
jgi:hypothetical protein